MKKIVILSVLSAAFLFTGSIIAKFIYQAQDNRAEERTKQMINLYNLTREQMEAVSLINVNFFKTADEYAVKYKNSLAELKAKYAKLEAQYQLKVLSLLNEDQKLTYFQEQQKIKEKPKANQTSNATKSNN